MKILKCEQVIHKNVIFLKTSQWYANCDKNENVSTTELSSNNVCDNLIHGLVHVFHSFDSAHRVSLLKCYPTIVSLLPFSFFSIYLLTRWFTSCYMFHSRPRLSQCNISYKCKQCTLPGKYSFGLLCYETCWGVLICILLVLAWLTPMSLRCETVNFFWRRKLNIHFCVNYLYSN